MGYKKDFFSKPRQQDLNLYKVECEGWCYCTK